MTEPNYYKGRPRPYDEAKALGVIDKNVLGLLEVMNHPPHVYTIASCQGHGLFYISVPPYVSFKASMEFAAKFASTLYDDALSGNPALNYYWEITASFDEKSELTYVLSAPGILSRKMFYARRCRVDEDFKLIASMVQCINDHFDGDLIC